MTRLPLEGIRVIDFSWIINGPQIAQWLAAMGAEVIKIESQVYMDIGRTNPGGMAERLASFAHAEAPQLPGFVEQAVLQARVLPLEVSDEAVDRLALGLDLGAALREGAQWRGNPYEHRHSRFLLRRV